MREAHELEQAVGMAYYASDGPGTGGRLRDDPGDFRVREIERFDTQPVGEDEGDYPWLVLRVTLYNTDTNDFARTLSNALGVSRERVSWAGTKDKNAVTTQLFSVRGIDPGDVPEVDGASIEVVGRAGRGVHFGDLLGNEFEIVVRDPTNPDRVDRIVTELEAQFDGQVGVPNFFGQQRFGSYRPITHVVGFEILRGDWEAAAMAYLGNTGEHEPERTREARSFVAETRNYSDALDRFPRHLRFERAMLHELQGSDEAPEDFRAALETFPRNVQRLFVHAAQSVLFNRILSERLERDLPFRRPVEGDVVCFADRDAPDSLPLADTDRCQSVSEKRVSVVRRHCERGRAFVTAPLIGTDSSLASGEPGDIERSVLEEFSVDREDFDLPGNFESSGDRRPVFIPVDPTIEHDPLSVEFRLPKGSYATVLMREFLKVSPLDL
ncbi:MAG: tRNA pseudouridine(13) synthase TruD [Halodesulfurarchaeum sp.]